MGWEGWMGWGCCFCIANGYGAAAFYGLGQHTGFRWVYGRRSAGLGLHDTTAWLGGEL